MFATSPSFDFKYHNFRPLKKITMANRIILSIFTFCFLQACNQQQEKTAETAMQSTTVTDSMWYSQSNIYEVNLRQYTKAGTIKAFAKSLPRLKEMGVEILWFMPITPIGIEGRKEKETDMGSYYAVRNYTAFNEDYGSMDDWKAFVTEAHQMGFKVITDWVANHTAPDNPWLKEHPEFYEKDSTGNFIAPFDWTDVRKLNYKNAQLRDSMIAAMKFWLVETGIDGFRCDVAAEVPTDFWKRCIDELRAINPSIFMLAEAEKPELHTIGFNASYAWSAMSAMENLYKGKFKLSQFDSVLNHNIETHPANAARMFFTSNHDENSWNGTEFEKLGKAYKTFAVFSATMYQSIPLIYSGQEMENKKRLKFFVKDTIPWNGNYPMAAFYKTLLTLRNTNPALASNASYKKMNSSDSSRVFAFAREKDGKKAVIILNMSNSAKPFTINEPGVAGEPLNVFMGVKEKVSSTHQFSIEPWGFIVYDYQ
jgi:alpha-amylase